MSNTDRIYALIRQRPGLSLRDAQQATGMARRSVYHAVKQLVADGKVKVASTMKDTRLKLLYPIDMVVT
jgi:predicted transcriptional regulator